MERLFVASHLAEAYIVHGLLTCAGIRATVFNEFSPGALGELPPTEVHPEVWLDDVRDLGRARQIVRHYENRSPVESAGSCPVCGEAYPAGFELCWNCGTIF